MMSLKIVAMKSNNTPKKMFNTRRNDLKTIRTQLKNISDDERKRVKDLWQMHKEIFNQEEEKAPEVIVMPDNSIDEFFDQ
jgi:hypothetical protein